MAILVSLPPCVLFEDEHLLIANKPPGLNTHSPAPYAGEGLYDWLRGREPRWANLAIIHRLDKGTSGLIAFAKTKLANKSLTEQFTARKVRKEYVFLSTNPPSKPQFTVQSNLVRLGDRYQSAPQGESAETNFCSLGLLGGYHLYSAQPLTGRTHQIRVHAADSGIPVLGDGLYGGAPFPRLCLHAQQLEFQHPATEAEVRFETPALFQEDPSVALRRAVIEPDLTNAFRLVNGGADRATYYLERWADYLLLLHQGQIPELALPPTAAVYAKQLDRHVSRVSQAEAAPRLLLGEPPPGQFEIRENGVRYEISFEQGYSVGLFLDQRDNRRRLLLNHVGPAFPVFKDGLTGKRVLNTFAYTCGFSLCAALAGAVTTSLDLSRKYLEWGQRNFRRNGVDPGLHDFIYGDVFEWTDRLRRKQRQFDLILLDPPTFSRSKTGTFQAERDYGKLVTRVVPMLSSGGVLFASTNANKMAGERFLEEIKISIEPLDRRITQTQYIPQPLDFPISGDEPGYLKTVWLRLD